MFSFERRIGYTLKNQNIKDKRSLTAEESDMRKYVKLLLCLFVLASGTGISAVGNAMASETALQENEEQQISSTENMVEDEMNAKAQKTKRLQGAIEDEQENRMIEDAQKDMLR